MYDFFCIIVCDTFAMRVVDRDRTDSICSANRCSIYLDAMDPRFYQQSHLPWLMLQTLLCMLQIWSCIIFRDLFDATIFLVLTREQKEKEK